MTVLFVLKSLDCGGCDANAWRRAAARCATLARSQDVCKESRSHVEGERSVVSSRSFWRNLGLIRRRRRRMLGAGPGGTAPPTSRHVTYYILSSYRFNRTIITLKYPLRVLLFCSKDFKKKITARFLSADSGADGQVSSI